MLGGDVEIRYYAVESVEAIVSQRLRMSSGFTRCSIQRFFLVDY